MGRLSHLGPRLGSIGPRLARQTDEHGHSPTLEPWRAWYNSTRWRALRRQVLLRDRFTCQCGCGVVIAVPAERIADHRRAHRGDPALFWDIDNLQTLWKPCHDGAKQREERGSRG